MLLLSAGERTNQSGRAHFPSGGSAMKVCGHALGRAGPFTGHNPLWALLPALELRLSLLQESRGPFLYVLGTHQLNKEVFVQAHGVF